MAQCRAYIESQTLSRSTARKVFPSVTISRQAGAGGLLVAGYFREIMEAQRKTAGPPWTIFDRALVQQILEDHHLPLSIAKFYPEDVHSDLEGVVGELLGIQPSSATMVAQTSHTIIKLAQKGHAILVGRGGNIIARDLPNVLHVRLVAPLDFRLEQAKSYYSFSTTEALNYINKADKGRARYHKRYFNRKIDDPLQYDLVLNTGSIGFETAAGLIATAVVAWQVSNS